FSLAFHRLRTPYRLVPPAPEPFPGGMYQHDFSGRRLFQHRTVLKWSLMPLNGHIPGFQDEQACLQDLERLRCCWDGRLSWLRHRSPQRALWRPTHPGLPTMAAWMITCQEREEVRKETLASLAASDWPDLPLTLLVDPEKTSDR